MISWQVLRGSRASRSAPDYRYQHGAGGSMHDCAAAAAPGGSSSLSREKVSLQQLNGRLASYLCSEEQEKIKAIVDSECLFVQVKHLEAANQRLEHQIQEELDRKCPQELRQLDRHLKTTSLLQDQIGECLSAQARLKLQLLEAELTIFDLSERCKKECEQRTHLEMELSDLRLLGEVLKAHNLPELQNLLNEQMQELADLQIQRQQDMQALLVEVTGGAAVEMHSAESSDLIQQVEHLRQMSTALLDKNQSESWFKTQVSCVQVCMSSSLRVTFDSSAGLEADRAKVEALRREVDHLTAELTELQAVFLVLEASGREQTESLLQQLVVLQRTADGLCQDLDSVLQAAVQQATDHQSLLDIKSRLEAEIQDYKKLLDRLDHEGVSCVHFTTKPDARSSCLATSRPTFRSNIVVDGTVGVQSGHAHTVGKTAVAAPLFQSVTVSQSIFVHNKHPTPTNPLVESIQKPDNQRTGVLSEKMRKSIISTVTASRQSSPVEDEVHAKDVQSSLFAGASISQEKPNKRAFAKASKTHIITTVAPDSTDTIQTKQETLISKQTGSQFAGRGTNIRVETNKTILCAEADINQQPHFETTLKPTSPEVQVRETLIFTQVDPCKGSFHTKKRNPTQIMTREAETSQENAKDMDESVSTIHWASGSSQVDRSTIAQGEVCGEVALMEDADGVDGKSGKTIIEAEQNKLTEDQGTRHNNENTSSGISENNNKLYSKTASTGNLNEEMVHDHKEVKMNPDHSDNESLSTISSETSTNLADPGVALSSSSSEEHQSPREAELMSSTKPNECLNLEMCPVTISHKPEIYLTPNVPETCLIPTEVRTGVNNGDVNRKEEAEDTLLVPSLDKRLAHMSKLKLMKDTESWSSFDVSSPESKENLKRKTQSTEVLKAEVDEMEIVNKANKVMMDPAKSNRETVDLAGEKLPKHSTSLTDSGVGLSCSSYEEFLSPEEVRLSANETKPPLTENLKGEVDKVEEVPNCKEVKMNPFQPDNELVNLQSQEKLVISASSETSTNLADPGVASSSSRSEEHQSPREAELMSSTKPDKCLNPEKCPVKSSHELEIYLTPNDADTCLIPTDVRTGVNRQRKKGTEEAEDTLLVLSLDESLVHMSNIKLMKDAESLSSIAVSSPESKENLKSKTQITEVLKTEQDEMEIVNNANMMKMDPAKSNKETVDLAGEKLPKHSTSLTDSGVSLSCSSYEEFLSLKEVRLSASETKPARCLSPELCLSLAETEVMLSLADQVFYPVGVEDHITSPDLHLSPNEPENDVSPNDSDTWLSPNGDKEDKATSLSLTEANTHVRPAEKYILSTKDEGQSVSFSADRTLPEDRNMKVIVSDRDVCFRLFEGYESRGVNLNGTKLSSRPITQSSGLQVSSSHAGLAFGDGRSIIADREEQLGFGGLYRKRDARRSRGKYAHGTPDEDKIESATLDFYASFGSVPSNKGTTTRKSGGSVSNRGDAQMATAGKKERVWSASGECKAYSDSLGHTSTSLPNPCNKEYFTERGRFGSGEWIDYGGNLRRKSSLDAATTLPSKGNGESSFMNERLATSPPETGSFGRRGSGEWIVYGGSLGHKGSWAGSDSSLSADSKECLPTAMNLPRSPPGAGRFGSGEWKLYGWRPGCMSSDNEDCPSAAMQLATSPPGTPGAGRFGSGGSVMYGGSSGRVSRASSADRASISRSQTISPPSSYTSSRRRLSSAGSGGRLSSGGIVRRSSSVGSTSGRFTSTGEWKPVYSSASGCKSSVGSAGWSGGGRTTNSPRALSPGGRIGVSGGSSGWLSSSKAAGSGSKLHSAGSNNKLSSYAGRGISSPPGSGRTNSTGGRVISSSDRPIRCIGSGAGSSKERISVCKMAALSISAAGRERSQERQRQARRAQQQQAAAPALADLRGHKL